MPFDCLNASLRQGLRFARTAQFSASVTIQPRKVAPNENHKEITNRRVRRAFAWHRQTVPCTERCSHRWPAALYILSWSAFVRRDARGEISLDSRSVAALAKPPPALWTEALAPHSLENVGTSDLHVISVEIKIPLPAGTGPKNA
jgi:hypothetical protein